MTDFPVTSSPTYAPTFPVASFATDGSDAQDYNFEVLSALPDGLDLIRSGQGWYQDGNGYLQHEASGGVARFGTVYGSDRGCLVEVTVTANNLYARPSTGVVGSHLSAGSSIASIVTDADNPSKDLTSGDQVWELDNSGGGAPVDVEWAGSISSGKASAAAYIKTISGDDATLTISGNTTEARTGHIVAGYTLHADYDRTVAGAEVLRITVPAGAVVRVAAVNLQAYDVNTSFIDTAGVAITRNVDDLNGQDGSWWVDVPEGVIVFDFTSLDDDAETAHFFEVRDNAINNRFTLWESSGVSNTTIESGNVVVVAETDPAIFNRSRIRTALSYKDNEFIMSRNGFTQFTDTSGAAPDVSTFDESANPISFLSINRSGAAPMSGVVHRFRLIRGTKTAAVLNAITNPNTPRNLWVTMFGDSNLLRQETHFDGRPAQRLIDNLTPHFDTVDIINKGDSSSAANYDGANAQGVDYWSDNGDAGGGTSYLQAIGPDTDNISVVENTRYQNRKLDYVIVNIAAGDIVSISVGTIAKAAYKVSMQNVLDLIVQDLGAQVKVILQYPPNADNPTYTEAAMQDVRNAMRELKAENVGLIIGSYDTYASGLVDTVHMDEDGYNNAVDSIANIILADSGLAELQTQPFVTGAVYNETQICVTCDRNVIGSDSVMFHATDDGTDLVITSAAVDNNRVILEIDSSILAESDVELYVAYGQITDLDYANAIRDVDTGKPLQSTTAITATEGVGAAPSIAYVLDDYVIDDYVQDEPAGALPSWTFDITGYAFASDTVDFSSDSSSPQGIYVSNDGTQVVIADNLSDEATEYTLSTPFVLSSKGAATGTLDFIGEDGGARDISFSADEDKLYMVGSDNDAIYQYEGTPGNLGSFGYASKSLDTSGQTSNISAGMMSIDGTKYYVVDNGTDLIFQYNGTGGDLDTFSYSGKSFSVAGEDLTPQGFFVAPAGDKFLVLGNTGNDFSQYSMTAGDISTGSFDSISLSVGAQDATPLGCCMALNGSVKELYMVGNADDGHRYN